jgi:nitroimidazol reductase NimA-like FMN-containing flavoprotein (pyridoxamine 5'-phosphate oxidase superfamily)
MIYRHMDANEVENLVREQRIVRVGFSANGKTYIVPLCYVWLDGEIQLMTSLGQKTEMAAANGRVAFQIDDFPETGLTGWASVIGEGDWNVVQDKDSIGRIAGAVMTRFTELADWAKSHPPAGPPMAFVRIKPRWMTGRAFPTD